MASDPRRFDTIAKVVSDQRRQLDDTQSTLLARLASHTHIATAGYYTSSTRPAAVVAGEIIHESDTHNNLVSNGSAPASGSWEHMSVPIVSSTASILVPYTGQIIYNTTDDLLYKYIGGAWIAFAATGTTQHEARYQQTSNQTFTNSTDTKIQFPSAITTCADVTASGTGNTDFTLGRAGLWQISVATAWLAATGTRYLSVQTGSTIDVTKRFTQNSIYSTGSRAITCACSTELRVAANTSICAIGWQDSGGNSTTDTFWGGVTHIAMTWLRP